MIRCPNVSTLLLISCVTLSLQGLSCGRDKDSTGLAPGTIPLYLSSDPSGAEIIIDGIDTQETTPDTFLLAEGSHTITLRSCDYEDWDRASDAVEGDTLNFIISLTPKFVFFDDFESGAGNWTAGCEDNSIVSNSYNGSNCLLLTAGQDCSTRLIDSYDLPLCLEPQVSFYYKLASGGVAVAFFRITDENNVSSYILLDETAEWTQVDVPSSTFLALSGKATFWFDITYSGSDMFRFYLDDFSLDTR